VGSGNTVGRNEAMGGSEGQGETAASITAIGGGNGEGVGENIHPEKGDRGE